ncbi:HNH endonuclease family protein [Marinobacter sp. KMM 10035]|uniref:HNH endonuclease family protein n=1 Tax=Marinobacter sp. KMM 10035 TaxID=3134034 RepID=UPI00397D044D
MPRNVTTTFIAVLALFGSLATQAQPVKMSKSGICHSPAGAHYDRTKNYQPFSTLESCLAEGGSLPKGMSEPKSKALALADTGYSRSKFGNGWADSDGDCQDSRAEALIAQSSTKVRFADERRCRVVTGRWISPFTGKVIQNASDIDIDHVVPLKWAWDHGANTWEQEKRERFANDPVNLWSVELSLNRQKGAKGPEDWLPPAGRCGYVSRFLRIVKIYKLEPSARQLNRYREQLADYCG